MSELENDSDETVFRTHHLPPSDTAGAGIVWAATAGFIRRIWRRTGWLAALTARLRNLLAWVRAYVNEFGDGGG
jgi:hypothetical protein